MAENLNYNADSSWCYGEGISEYVINDNYRTLTNSEIQANCANYGRLYNWAAAMGIEAKYNIEKWNGSDDKWQGICPRGWHLPSDLEWRDLMSNGSARGMKARSGWKWYEFVEGGGNGTDDYGFSALPGGYRSTGGRFYADVGERGTWWTATENSSGRAYCWDMHYSLDNVQHGIGAKDAGFSVRCIKDD
jgi:uncharacterized protein (TIGR02145 family)